MPASSTVSPEAAHERAEPVGRPDRHGASARGREVLIRESEALVALAGSLGETFEAVVDTLAGVAGRVIVTGIGKSGHVARKIAATLASTGTPSFFVHSGEASHGDLGMVTASDAVLALSNSGGTTELSDIVAYAKRLGIPLIAMTSRALSPLDEQATLSLILPPAEEACPWGLAPTTSTTLMMALGDALAVALLERRGFTVDEFRIRHPGGALGRRLIKVQDIMHTGGELPLTGPEAPVSEAILKMTARGFGCVGVIDEAGHLTGIITDGDLRRHMSDTLLSATAGEIMTHGPTTIRPSALAAEAVAVMNAGNEGRGITSLFVVGHDGAAQGIIHIHDCLRAGVV